MGTPAAPSASPPLPGWLGPIVTLTTQVGVPTVVAGVVLWFVLFRVDSTLKIIQENEENRTRMVAAMQDSLVSALNHNASTFEKAIDKNIAVNEEHARDLERILERETTRKAADPGVGR